MGGEQCVCLTLSRLRDREHIDQRRKLADHCKPQVGVGVVHQALQQREVGLVARAAARRLRGKEDVLGERHANGPSHLQEHPRKIDPVGHAVVGHQRLHGRHQLGDRKLRAQYGSCSS